MTGTILCGGGNTQFLVSVEPIIALLFFNFEILPFLSRKGRAYNSNDLQELCLDLPFDIFQSQGESLTSQHSTYNKSL